MISAVLDTNVLASGFVRSQSVPGALLALWGVGAYNLLTSEVIIKELDATFQQPYFQRYLSQELIDANLLLLREEATIAPITVRVQGKATHPEDDLILATAVSAKADYLVTGDKKLRGLGSYRGVTLVSPREFFDIMVGLREQEVKDLEADKEE